MNKIYSNVASLIDSTCVCFLWRLTKTSIKSIGNGKIIVELRSELIVLRVCKKRS